MHEFDPVNASQSLLVPSKAQIYEDSRGVGTFREDENEGGRKVCGMKFSTFLWLSIFCATGVGLGLCYEFLEIHSNNHSPGASAQSFFLCLLGYFSQAVFGGIFAFCQKDPLKGSWTKPILVTLFLSSICDGLAQALDLVGQVEGGYMLFTIFHSSVTLFSCLLAVVIVGAKVSKMQWGGVLLVIAGLFVTAVPSPFQVPGNFLVGVSCSLLGSFFLAASYPFSEKVFRLGALTPRGPPKAETACFFGALINTLIYVVYTCVYTVPRWDEEVTSYWKEGDTNYVIAGFVMYGFLVGLHSLSFWKSVNVIGTVPTAVAKGAQQAGVFVFSHIVYCNIDKHECMFGTSPKDTLWHKIQKSCAALFCVAGVVIYSLGRKNKQ
jgi:drug/metabolite transporter (DMT)-like permease